MKQRALLSSLVMKLQSQEVQGIVDLAYETPKTKEAYNTLQSLSLHEKKTLLIVDEHVQNVYKTRRNIPHVSITTLSLVNPYDILTHKQVLFTEGAVNKLPTRFHLLTQSA